MSYMYVHKVNKSVCQLCYARDVTFTCKETSIQNHMWTTLLNSRKIYYMFTCVIEKHEPSERTSVLKHRCFNIPQLISLSGSKKVGWGIK